MTVKHKEQRVAVFVDVQNMYYSAKNLYQAKVDFGAVLNEAVAGRKLIRAFAYVIKADVGAEAEFFEALSKRGYEVREKGLQTFYDGSKKGDWDVGLCMDIVRMLQKIDVVVLASGDGDYAEMLEYAQSQGVRTEIIAFGKSSSSKLFETADEIIDMGENPKKFLISNYSRNRTTIRPNRSTQTRPNSPRSVETNSPKKLEITDLTQHDPTTN
jgi:uncharacterized LabA/DUF88 family protein